MIKTGKYLDLSLVVLVVLMLPQLSVLFADLFYPSIQSIDPDETFLYKSVHHLFQLILTVLLMIVISKKANLKAWGFNLKNWKTSLTWIFSFFILYGVLEYVRVRSNFPSEFAYPLTSKNQFGIQAFQYLLSGLGEEPLFRGFVMVFLATHWRKRFSLGKLEFPITLVLATILFMIAHLNISWVDMTVSGFDFDQQMKSLQMGIVYGLAFYQTKSLLAPIVMHGLSNGIQFTIAFYLIN